MTRITAFVLVCLFTTPALANDKTPCWKIQGWVAQYGKFAVKNYARFNGYSARLIASIEKRCKL